MGMRGFDIGLGALSAQQRAIDVLNHNIANATTPGYSRQRIRFHALPPNWVLSLRGSNDRHQAGQGVEIAAVERVRDLFLDRQLRSESLRLESSRVREDNFSKLESVFNEPSDTGLSNGLGKFWSAWQDLSSNPSDTASRASVLQQGMTLTNQVNTSYRSLVTLRDEMAYLASSQATDVNHVAAQLATLNDELHRAQLGGGSANDLLDRRDLLLDELSTLIDANVAIQPDGTVAVFVDGQELVSGVTSREMRAYQDASFVLHLEWVDTAVAVNPTGGKLHGTLLAANTDVAGRLANLDALALQLRDDLNAIHRTGYDRAGNPAGDFFVGAGAQDLRIDTAIQANIDLIATSGQPNAAGDGSVAMAIAQLAHSTSKVDVASEVATGLALPVSGATVQRVVANGARPNATYTFTSTAAGQITVTATVGATVLTQTVAIADMAANEVQTLDFTGLGIRVALRAGAGGATAANLITDLTAAGTNDLAVTNRSTVENNYQKLVVQLGIDARGAKSDRVNSEALHNNLELRRQSISGVSLDEEAARLTEHMRAYQAAARVITTLDEMMNHLINNVGVVGR